MSLAVLVLASGCVTTHRTRAPYPLAEATSHCLLHCDDQDRACMQRCPGVREEVGSCEGLPAPCVERVEANTAATLVLIAAILGGIAFGLVRLEKGLENQY